MTRALLLLLWVPLAAAAEAPALSAEAYAKLLARSAAVLQDALKEEKPSRRAADRARVVAVLLAEAAQQDLTGQDAAGRAAVRDAALTLNQHLRDQEVAQARLLARSISQLKPASTFSRDKVILLGSHIEMDELMCIFRKTNLGGLDIEAEYDRLESDSRSQSLAAAELTERLELAAYQTALVGEMIKEYKPEKNPAQWRRYAESMRQQALALATAVKAKDGPAAYRALTAGNANCTTCHKMFR